MSTHHKLSNKVSKVSKQRLILRGRHSSFKIKCNQLLVAEETFLSKQIPVFVVTLLKTSNTFVEHRYVFFRLY